MTETNMPDEETWLLSKEIAAGESPSRIALRYAIETGEDMRGIRLGAGASARLANWLMYKASMFQDLEILERSRKFLETFPDFFSRNMPQYVLTGAAKRDELLARTRPGSGTPYSDFVKLMTEGK